LISIDQTSHIVDHKPQLSFTNDPQPTTQYPIHKNTWLFTKMYYIC